jgi:transposase
MVWTKTTRELYRRDELRFASDMRTGEWELIEPLLPERRRWGRPRTVDLRAVIDALLYILATGCQWRALPREFPPRSTVQRYFYQWRDDGLWQKLVDALVPKVREREGRKATPTLGIIDSQSAPTTESGGPRGLDMGKKIKGRKRHIVTDVEGNILAVIVHSAAIQDCHGAVPLLKLLRKRFPELKDVLADRVYRGDQLKNAVAASGKWNIQIVERPAGVKGFLLLPKRWIVERTFAWLGRCRRLAKDFERTIESATAWILLAHLRLLSRRLAKPLSAKH